MPSVIGIIGGHGKMGTYFSRFFRALGYKIIIADIHTKLTNTELAKKADVVIVSVPIERTLNVIREIAPHVREDALLMDLTSIKVEPVKEMMKSKSSVIGCHPIFAAFSGMKNQIVAVCPARPGKWMSWIKKIVKEGAGRLKILTPKKHDKLMAVVQVLTHFSDITLAYTLKELGTPIGEFLECQSPPYRLKLDMMGRILDQDPGLYGNIMLSNPDRVKVMDAYLKAEKQLRDIAKKQDLKEYIRYFNAGAKYLGNFRHVAMRESNYLIDVLNSLITIEKKQVSPNKNDIAVLGPENTYSDKAARKYAPHTNRYYCQTISEIFDRVKKGQVQMGIVPVENKGVGAISETLDELYNSGLYIQEEVILSIRFCLAGTRDSSLRKIRFVLSKDAALAQCSWFLQKNLPKASLLPETSTAAAMEKILRENLYDAAAIGDREGAKKLGLKILKENIGNIKDNKTKFLIITNKKQAPKIRKGVTTSIAVLVENKPGTLASAINAFSEQKINLIKIQSRPTKRALGEYIFFLDFEGSMEDNRVQKALKKVKRNVKKLKVFGCYGGENLLTS